MPRLVTSYCMNYFWVRIDEFCHWEPLGRLPRNFRNILIT